MYYPTTNIQRGFFLTAAYFSEIQNR